NQRRLYGQFSDERLGPADGLRHRTCNSAWRDQQQLTKDAAALRFGLGYSQIWNADRPVYRSPCPVRFADQFALPQTLVGKFSIRRGSRGRAHARALADDRLGDTRPR